MDYTFCNNPVRRDSNLVRRDFIRMRRDSNPRQSYLNSMQRNSNCVQRNFIRCGRTPTVVEGLYVHAEGLQTLGE